ncbi:FitA-like ribbon-helix-helix domain-containing protein [Aerosakkonema funiforme]|uniref:FitA-like ribbon-helix-helix domain-containing protein n=1 Tax=Aerosakkonema funiforme TaxID=1246630 RepID=UPI0035B92736
MAQLTIEDLDPALLEKLEALAKEHGRSLQAELKHILETATRSQTNNLADDWEAIRKKADLMRQQIIAHAASKGINIEPPEKKSDPTEVIKQFRLLRGKISAGDMSIREMREEGRRF